MQVGDLVQVSADHCSHLSPADSGALEAKLSPAIRTSKWEPKKVRDLEIDN
jgi:hypothetical protein